MKRSTKHSLLLSILALVLCTAMLLGTTFAWFTDSASTAVNKIEAGRLEIQLLDANEQSLEGKTLAWQKAAGAPANEQVLWEPGCTYKLQPITIKNSGNLALKYKIAITGIKGDAELNDVIDWTIKNNGQSYAITQEVPLAAGASANLTIEGHMQESAGNEYQNKFIDGIGITVYATQNTVESDSNNDQYDVDAEYPVVVSSQDAFSQTVAASPNSNIVLSAGTYTLPAAADKTIAISGTKDTIIDLTSATGLSGTDITFENVTVKGINSDYVGIQHSGDIVYNNVTFNDSTTLYGESVTFNNCTFNLTSRYIWTYGAKEVTFNNCIFNTDGKAILIYAEGGVDSQTVNVNGCTFNATHPAYTSSNDHCAAVEIDASLITGKYTVNFTGTNTVDPDFSALHRIKNNSESKVIING